MCIYIQAFLTKRTLSEMDKFIQKAMVTYKEYDPIDFIRFSHDLYKYHVIVHESAFQSFLKKLNGNTIPHDACEHNNHVHFLVRSKYPFEGNRGIISRSIENMKHSHFVWKIFNFSTELELYCNITFEISSLEDMAMIEILSNLCNLHDLKQLNLPVSLTRKIFQRVREGWQNFIREYGHCEAQSHLQLTAKLVDYLRSS